MTEERDNTNRGVLFRNERKDKDTSPDYTGNIVLPDGAEHWLSAWINTSKAGKKYMSLIIGNAKEPATESTDRAAADFDDDIPF